MGRKNLFYVPGLLSLVILPLVLLYAREYVTNASERVIEVTLADPNNPMHQPPARNYQEFSFTGNKRFDVAKFNYSQVLLEEYLRDGNLSGGIRYHFEGEAKYDMFIQVLSLAKKLEISCMPSAATDDIWVWPFQSLNPKYRNLTVPGSCIVIERRITRVQSSRYKYYYKSGP
jgi:hypothetical protein